MRIEKTVHTFICDKCGVEVAGPYEQDGISITHMVDRVKPSPEDSSPVHVEFPIIDATYCDNCKLKKLEAVSKILKDKIQKGINR